MELVRRGETRISISFLTLQRLHGQKIILERCRLWKTNVAKDHKVKKATDIIFMLSFSNDADYTLKAVRLLVSVPRLVDHVIFFL